MRRSVAVFFLLAIAALDSQANAAMVQVNFSGGSGTPLTITLPQPVSYTVVNFPTTAEALFVFQGTGNVLSSVGAGGSLSFTQNAGAPNSIDRAGQINTGQITLNDLHLFNLSFFGLSHNDVLLLSAGSVTTTTNIAAPAPPSGLYSTFLTDGAGENMGPGTAVPEPSTLVLALGGLASLAFVVRRRTLHRG